MTLVRLTQGIFSQEMEDWLVDNIGLPDPRSGTNRMLDSSDWKPGATWRLVHVLNSVIRGVEFKDEAHAVLFSLRWS